MREFLKADYSNLLNGKVNYRVVGESSNNRTRTHPRPYISSVLLYGYTSYIRERESTANDWCLPGFCMTSCCSMRRSSSNKCTICDD